jgi:hypothetical protein
MAYQTRLHPSSAKQQGQMDAPSAPFKATSSSDAQPQKNMYAPAVPPSEMAGLPLEMASPSQMTEVAVASSSPSTYG